MEVDSEGLYVQNKAQKLENGQKGLTGTCKCVGNKRKKNMLLTI